MRKGSAFHNTRATRHKEGLLRERNKNTSSFDSRNVPLSTVLYDCQRRTETGPTIARDPKPHQTRPNRFLASELRSSTRN
ncbi:histone-lysine N-methyltransferase SETD2-like protein [Anopheles sinensis]|uniref:Histone-lysine N-methyltransferase SETD2-like protein n=1 Tax=Anopheles sinensis TaxID=74873 RepID=A0A084VPC1_ANOSI|nr:histone-lysine N-methyltransferase SETD2-like protein [Anopheles sinensis]